MARKTKLYIVWIEGIHWFRGEKLKCLTDYGYDITTKVTEAARVREQDIETIRQYLKRHGVADWAIGYNSFIPTSYAPPGTIIDMDRLAFGR